MSIKIDLQNIVAGTTPATNFTSQLLRLIFKADSRNEGLLHKGFPNAVEAVKHFQETGAILDLKQD
ncbi:hypothetical protein LCGC14_0915780 [marine sediment metagenome]|uniref:Uncharacterized protein n=1 Tax=marine sediment metagenome TaxID=412755 RepID=A0A0F9RB36_9ZZZZ